MAGLARLPRWSVEVVRTLVILAIVLAVGTVYQARGVPATTYYACLYAGSLSQVNTTASPANCGRGVAISWNAEGIEGLPGTNGIDGIDGVSGYEIVQSEPSEDIEPGATLMHAVNCPIGKVVLGGGPINTVNGSIVEASYPTTAGPNTGRWEVWLTNTTDEPEPFEVSATCATMAIEEE